ncbi:DUF1320 domain-containing protein (plasmid) [Tistrella mobilis]|uniref:gp436 family protein n=1 Tax=Tistrella mobilis TaxID=171437 RepID=UPI003558A835
MAYASAEEWRAAVGALVDRIADVDGDGAADPAAIDRALAEASAEVDAYVGVRYPLPLPSTPVVLRSATIDIATYRLAGGPPVLTDDIRDRYEDAMSRLRDIAAGRARLDLPQAAHKPPRPVVIKGRPRLFDRGSLGDLV